MVFKMFSNLKEFSKEELSSRKVNNMTLTVNKINYTNFSPSFKSNPKRETERASLATKIAATTGSCIGVASALALVTRKNNLGAAAITKNSNNLLKTLKNLELGEKDVIEIASGAIAGGFLGGSITDPKNTKAKAKEGIVQLIGNYIIPTLFVGAGIKFNKALNKRFSFPPITKVVQFAFGFASLIAGVFAGNRISREMNANIFKEDSYRALNWKDWGMQFDNVCLVTSVSHTGTNLAQVVSKAIPVAHIVPGYLTGTKKGEN